MRIKKMKERRKHKIRLFSFFLKTFKKPLKSKKKCLTSKRFSFIISITLKKQEGGHKRNR